jgi:hypothetical protein
MSIVQQIHRLIPAWTSQTQVNTLCRKNKTLQITNTFVRKLLHATCHNFGGKATFAFHQADIGNKSIRSGAAMALFLQNISSTRIMLFGRWASKAFLVYIQPQVLEWTTNMSRDMINIDSFFEAELSQPPNMTTNYPGRQNNPFNGSLITITIPRLHLEH